MSQVLALVGTEQQKRWARIGLERGWTGTMALTEPDAGSDVGAGRTKGIAPPDGTWHIEGVKRFISGVTPVTPRKTCSTSCWRVRRAPDLVRRV